MVFNTITVGTAVTPTVIETYFSHYLNRKPLKQKPTAHVSYHEGLNLIRQFLNHASHHTVEDIQGFTSQWVPSPRWIKVDEVTIPQESIAEAANAIIAQLGHHGIDKVGGETWWQWRREGGTLWAEWIEMRRDYTRRKNLDDTAKRIMLSNDMLGSWRLEYLHARYRLSPQFPFPCAILDCLAAYIYLLTVQSASEIILAGDSAGGGLILSLLVILRDRGFPLPAGAILISPWVDLTHSFPSVAGDGSLDFIPAHGFLQRPSAAWPPPNTDDMEQIALSAVERTVSESLPRKSTQQARREATEEAVQGFAVDHNLENLRPHQNAHNPAGMDGAGDRPGNTIPGDGHDLSIMIDEKFVDIKDQIQMYTTNQLISHPLVSPVLQPSLGGLPPLLILTGGGEVLRDEQIYIAHKAANPSKYPPGDAYLDGFPEARDAIAKWKPTDVHLQVWDDLCHVAPTLSFTRPAKFMYRSIAQFGAWALARAQKVEIEIMDDDEMSVISSGSDTESEGEMKKTKQTKSTMENGVAKGGTTASDQVGKAGKALPPFKNHMIRQRVDRHGNIYPLDPPSALASLQMSPNEIGIIKPGPVTKWLVAKKEWDTKYAKEKRRVQKQRAKEMAQGFQGFGNDEVPPPSALAGRRGLNMPKEEKRHRSWGMSLWSLWGSSHDENTMAREEKADKEISTTTATQADGTNARPQPANRMFSDHLHRSHSRRRGVSDLGQSNNQDSDPTEKPISAAEITQTKEGAQQPTPSEPPKARIHLAPPAIATTYHGDDARDEKPLASTSLPKPLSPTRPSAGGVAYPFKLGTHLTSDGRSASTITLEDEAGVVGAKGSGSGKGVDDVGPREEVARGGGATGGDATMGSSGVAGVDGKEVGKKVEAEGVETAKEGA